MNFNIEAPEKRLAKKVVNVWIITDLLRNGLVLLILGLLLYLRYYFVWPLWTNWLLLGVVSILLLLMIWTTILRPRFLYKNWRYDINEEFLQTKSGAFFEKYTLIPMSNIQSVKTSQGPLLRKYGLYSLTAETIASRHEIPALPKAIAIELREKIAHYANVKEVDS